MPIPTWVTGQVLTASDLNVWLVPQAAYKGSDQTVTSSTTLVNDTALSLPLTANSTYWIELEIKYEGGTNGSSDMKLQINIPSGAVLSLTLSAYFGTDGAVHGGSTIGAGSPFSVGTNGGGNPHGLHFSGACNTSSTAGAIQVQFAQSTSSGTGTILHSGSAIMAQRIG